MTHLFLIYMYIKHFLFLPTSNIIHATAMKDIIYKCMLHIIFNLCLTNLYTPSQSMNKRQNIYYVINILNYRYLQKKIF